MGFSLGGFMSGAATAVDSKMKSDKIEREAERSKVEDMIFKTSARLFENASLVQDSRTKDIKSNKKYMNKLVSMAPSIASDPAKQAFILGLDDVAREDLITMVNDPKFNPEKRPLADYLEAIDDPVEFKDPVTLSQRVQGVVTPRPMDSSAYYGVSTTKDKEVDKIVSSYTDSFAVAYGMTAAKAQGLLDAAKEEVRVQSFSIDWVHKKSLAVADAAIVTAQVATAGLNTEKSKIAVKTSYVNAANAKLKRTRELYIQSSGIPSMAFQADKNNEAKYLESDAYKNATRDIIRDAVLNMEQHPILEEATTLFLSESFPGKFGGEVGEDNPIESLKPDTYYVGTFTNGRGVATGAQIQAAKGITGGTGNEGFEDIKVNTKAGDTTEDAAVETEDTATNGTEAATILAEIASGNRGEGLGSRKDANDKRNDKIIKQALYDVNNPEAEEVVKPANPNYVPDSMQLRTNETSMEIAIEEGDADKVQKILDNLQRMLDEDPSFDKRKKIGSVRGDGLRALKELLQGK